MKVLLLAFIDIPINVINEQLESAPAVKGI